MKNSSNSTSWNLSDDMLSMIYAEENEAELSAEAYSWETDPMTLLQDLEEWDEEDKEDDFDGLF